MSTSDRDKIFREKVEPIMERVRADLDRKIAWEVKEHGSSFSALLAGAAGPDGGMAAMDSHRDTLRYTGKWSSKTTEDYIAMVSKELRLQHITVDAAMERKMIDKMIQDVVPQSSAEYILRKAARSSLFHLPQEVRKSSLDHYIEQEAEKRYNPTALERNAGFALASGADFLSMGGLGGGISAAATWVGGDLLINNAMDRTGIPSVIAPGHEEEYLRETLRKEEIPGQAKEPSPEPEKQETEASTPVQEEPRQQNPEQGNTGGWSGLLSSLGLNRLGDITHNLGYVLAMLPDMLVGIFTGKTKSLKIQDNLLPLASIVAGMFIRNPILKMVLMGTGGLNLLSKAGHEALAVQKEKNVTHAGRTAYRVYADELLNERITAPQIKGNYLIANIDRIPCTIALPDRVIDAYQQGALPLNTLANAVLARNDQMRQMAQRNYEQNEQQTVTRTLSQR